MIPSSMLGDLIVDVSDAVHIRILLKAVIIMIGDLLIQWQTLSLFCSKFHQTIALIPPRKSKIEDP